MKRFIPFVLAASLAIVGCGKSDGTGDTEKPIQEVKTGTDIRDKYISAISELQNYQHFAEGRTLNQKYKTIGALRGTDVLVAYIDASGKLFLMTKFKIDSKFIDKIGQIGFAVDGRSKPSDIAALMFLEKLNSSGPTGSPMPAFYSIVYPHNEKLVSVGIDVSNLDYKFISYMNLSYKTFYCYNGAWFLSFYKSTGAPLLQDTKIPEDFLMKSITAYYFEENRMIVLYNESGNLIVKCFPTKRPSDLTAPLWQNMINGYGYLGEKGIDISDDDDNLIIKLKEPNIQYKYRKSTGLVVY
ncbi:MULTISPECIES: hypothetical protein [Sphingobacterium]|uniref:hypothetical protein n=1 Tax=Sphingobacterium TaxID=28453 RepID=UPI00257C2A8D|nr:MULTISPECIES: hypothetical protein [Sphingobacterium]